MGRPLASSCEAHYMIRSIAHDQPRKNFKYVWLDLSLWVSSGTLSKYEKCVVHGQLA